MFQKIIVNGAVMSVRAKGDKISLWTKHAIDMDLQKRIGYIKNILK